MSEQIDEFVDVMRRFVECSLKGFGPEVLEKALGGKDLTQGANEVLASVLHSIRGNRGPDAPFTFADLTAIMDAVAVAHLRFHHRDPLAIVSALSPPPPAAQDAEGNEAN
jgi:hypothetical protein